MLEDNPYGLLRYEGDPLPPLLRARRRRLRDVPGHVLEDPLARDPARLGRARRRRCSRRSTSASRRPTCCTSTLSQLMVQAYFEQGDWRDYVDSLTERLPRAARHDARRARRALPAPGGVDAPRAAGSSSGRRCRTSSTPPTCWRARCARTSRSCRARARSSTAAAASSMRLNFSGSDEDQIREGIRRIGEVVTEQVALYGTLTGEAAPEPAPPRHRRRTSDRRRRSCDAAPAASASGAEPRRQVSRVAVLKGGRSLERQVSLRSGARVEDALERLGHEVVADRRRRRPDPPAARRSSPTRLRRAARARRRGRHGPGAARDPRHPVHRLRASSRARARPTRC